MLIIHPPLTKACEPPAPLAYLLAALKSQGHSCTICDMNVEALLFLLKTALSAEDTWSKRAYKNIGRNLDALKAISTYNNIDRYKRSVSDLNRIVQLAGEKCNLQLSLANYQDNTLSPLKSDDLSHAATHFRNNIFFDYFSKRLEKLIEQSRPEYIGFSLSYLSQALCTFAMIGFLKDRFPEKKIILGGGLVTTWLSKEGWHNPFSNLVDHFIPGQGEIPLLQLLGANHKWKPVKPDYTSLATNTYLSPGFILPYAASTGCFWKKCSFCPETSEDNPYQCVAPETVVLELQKLCKETAPSLIHLLDNAISPAALTALANHPPGRPWYGFARIDSQLGDPTFCKQLRSSGCLMLKLGLESGDQHVLDSMHKGIDLELATTVLHNLHRAGITTYVYLLFGTPSEDHNRAQKTLDFVTKNHQNITFLNHAIFNLPAGSSEIAALDVSDFYEGDLSIYRNFNHPKGWNRGKIRRYLDSTFKRRPEIARIIQRDPPFFTSNHAPFFSSCFSSPTS